MNKQDLKIGDVVQIFPREDGCFSACFMTVEKVKTWGAVGCIMIPAKGGPNLSYYRAKWEEMEYIGPAAFLSELSFQENDDE